MWLILGIFLVSKITGENVENALLSFVSKYDGLSERHEKCQENLNQCITTKFECTQRVNTLELLGVGELERKFSTLRFFHRISSFDPVF